MVYFSVWPVAIDPVSWEAPSNPGYSGPFETNELLKKMEKLPIGDNHGPEDLAVDSAGHIYASTHEGRIVHLQPDGTEPENWAETGGRPLGIEFDNNGNLIVADAFLGLLSIAKDGSINELTTAAEGIPIRYANDVDIAENGLIYFTDSSTKFSALKWGDTYVASLLDIFEHGSHGRLLVYNPADGSTKVLMDGLNFANGIAISRDQSYLLVNETGSYRVLRYWLTEPQKGQSEPFLSNLPAFPDNLSTGLDGRFWVALISPRNALLDNLSDNPFLRKVIQRMPAFVRPQAESYGHIIAVDGDGNVVKNMQDPDGGYPKITTVAETKDYLFTGSLVAPTLGRLSKDEW
ncbi:SMP-30/gluconolactonase/LRE family protein [Aliifodinibius sp. S!AR15-10]|uniref:SMP-30/gluconolactonase/LRE family protein n=1 Tax=Aliifodinibius sp. S!AR15-10 TaxID=2950437 RepID=UPI0028701E3A|nr:SMP-30/gluconolactonase/LRE family protein [Aliifodinibius sp. S!AR15-10]